MSVVCAFHQPSTGKKIVRNAVESDFAGRLLVFAVICFGGQVGGHVPLVPFPTRVTPPVSSGAPWTRCRNDFAVHAGKREADGAAFAQPYARPPRRTEAPHCRLLRTSLCMSVIFSRAFFGEGGRLKSNHAERIGAVAIQQLRRSGAVPP